MPIGKRIVYRPEKAHCPHCQNVLLTPEHCFTQCPLIKELWNIIDKMGADQFNGYYSFKMVTFLDLGAGYIPQSDSSMFPWSGPYGNNGVPLCMERIMIRIQIG